MSVLYILVCLYLLWKSTEELIEELREDEAHILEMQPITGK